MTRALDLTTTPRAPAKRGLSRREALKVVAAAAAIPASIAALRAFGPQASFHTWNGVVMGGDASLSLWHPDEGYARQTVAKMLSEVERLERVFSLFRPESEISRLNRDGSLPGASSDFRAVVGESLRMAELSAGAFDPTVQPLWELFATHFRAHPDSAGPGAADLDAALSRVDFASLAIDGRTVSFGRPGMAATLNAIAQGYVTDRVSDLLRMEGFDHVVVELGEIRTLGLHPEGRPWRLGLKDPANPFGAPRMVDVAEAAVSVSGGYGTTFETTGRNHHIFDPATGRSAARLLDATVIGPRATVADALSTALCVAGEERAPALLSACPGYRAILTRVDGTMIDLAAA